MGFHSNWSCFTLRSVTKDNLWNWFPSSLELFYCSFCDQREPLKWVSILTGVVLPFVLWQKTTFEMGFHSHWSCFTLRTVTKVNLWNGFPFWLELFYPSFCDQSEPFKWVSKLELFYHFVLWPKRTFKMVSILTGVVLPFVLWPKRTFEMGFHSHWSCFTVRSAQSDLLKSMLTGTFDQSEPFKWVSILTGVVLPLRSVFPSQSDQRTFEMGFHSHWSCFTLRSVTKVNLWNGFPSSLELFYPSFCDQSEPLKWVSIHTGVVLPFVLWPKRTFEMGFHPHWSCFTLRSVTKENLWNGFPSSLELFYPSFCEPFKVSILTGTFEMGFHPHWSCFTLRSVTKENLLNGFPFSLELFYSSNCDQSEPLKWVSILTGVVLPFVLWPKWTFEMGFHSNWSCFTLRSVTKDNLWNWFPSSLELFYCSFCDQREPLKWVSILTGVVLPFVLWPKWTF